MHDHFKSNWSIILKENRDFSVVIWPIGKLDWADYCDFVHFSLHFNHWLIWRRMVVQYSKLNLQIWTSNVEFALTRQPLFVWFQPFHCILGMSIVPEYRQHIFCGMNGNNFDKLSEFALWCDISSSIYHDYPNVLGENMTIIHIVDFDNWQIAQ